jgi:DNA-binding transcriptional MerR regulator
MMALSATGTMTLKRSHVLKRSSTWILKDQYRFSGKVCARREGRGTLLAMPYNTRQAASIYKVTPQTMNTWAKEFASYLTATANPGGKRQRQFTKEDMRVFSLVSEMQRENLTFTDIHASLASGARGDVPLIEPDEVKAIVAGEVESQLSLENERLRSMLVEAQTALRKAEKDLTRLREVEDEVVVLKTELRVDKAAKEELIARLERQIEQITKRNEELSSQSGEQFTRGYLKGFQDRNQVERDEETLPD